jgi:hypothetical protein
LQEGSRIYIKRSNLFSIPLKKQVRELTLYQFTVLAYRLTQSRETVLSTWPALIYVCI